MAEMNVTFRALANYVETIGLTGLFSYSGGKPQGWLWDQVKNGITAPEELLVTLQDTDEFKQRFPIIAEQQALAAKGELVGSVMTPENVLNYEQEVSEVFRVAGLPASFYDEPTDFLELMRNNIPATDIQDRINIAFDSVANAPDDVRDMFEEYFGVGQSDSALAAYVLDPDMVTSRLERERNMAFAGAVGRRYDIDLSRTLAEDIATATGSLEGVQQGMTNLGQDAGMFGETIGSGNTVSLEQGIAAEFGIDTGTSQTDAQQALERRKAEARSFGTSAGGAVVTQQGVTGLG
jgi:hypothetical protein